MQRLNAHTVNNYQKLHRVIDSMLRMISESIHINTVSVSNINDEISYFANVYNQKESLIERGGSISIEDSY